MAIKCGNGPHYHDTVVQVKRCHGQSYQVRDMSLVDYLTDAPLFCVDCGIRHSHHQNAAGTVGRYLKSDLHPDACAKVQEELELAPMMPFFSTAVGTWAEWVTMYRAHQAQQVPGLSGVTYGDAAATFRAPTTADHGRDANLAAATGTENPRYAGVRTAREQARVVLAALAPGHDKFRVAVQLPDDKLRFFQIDTPLRGKWAGCVFTKEQAGDDLYKVRDIVREEAVLRAVIADALGCLERYGLELGACGLCGRTLTDEESRARGIGPVCIDKL